MQTTALLILMIIYPAAPQVFAYAQPTTIPGWKSIEACRSAIPTMSLKYGFRTEASSGILGANPSEATITPARVECLGFENR